MARFNHAFTLDPPPSRRIKLISNEQNRIVLKIVREGFSARGIFVLSIVVFWLLLISAWAFMLLQYGVAWSLLSLPFWALGILTLINVIKVLRQQQSVVISEGMVQIIKSTGKTTAHVELSLKNISTVTLVEGTFKTLAGISRKGVYPAFIANGEAFGIGERCNRAEKQWLLQTLQSILR